LSCNVFVEHFARLGLWEGGETFLIDNISEKLTTEYTPIETQEEVVVKSVHSILHWINKNNPLSGTPENPAGDPQYRRWESPVQLWAKQQGLLDESEAIPTEFDDIHTLENLPSLSVSGIDEDTVYSNDDTITLQVTGEGKFPLSRVEVYFNDRYITVDDRSPFKFSINLSDGEIDLQEKNSVRVLGIDEVYNRAEYVADLFAEES